MFKEDCTQYCKNCFKLQKALDEIERIIDIMGWQPTILFPDYSLFENARIITEYRNIGYTKILDVINKIKGGANDRA